MVGKRFRNVSLRSCCILSGIPLYQCYWICSVYRYQSFAYAKIQARTGYSIRKTTCTHTRQISSDYSANATCTVVAGIGLLEHSLAVPMLQSMGLFSYKPPTKSFVSSCMVRESPFKYLLVVDCMTCLITSNHHTYCVSQNSESRIFQTVKTGNSRSTPFFIWLPINRRQLITAYIRI